MKNTGKQNSDTPSRIRQEITAKDRDISITSVEEAKQVCDSIDRIIGEWKYVLQNNGNDKHEHTSISNTRKNNLSRAHSVPILTNYGFCPKNTEATNTKCTPRLFAPIEEDKAMSEINEKAKGDGVPYIPGI